METFIIRAGQFLLAITLLVFLHEGGHFCFAKLFKTRVSRFYIFANWHFHLFSSYDNWFRRLLGKPLITERDDEGVHFLQKVKNAYYQLTNQKDRIQTKNVGNKKYDDKVGTEYGIGWLPLGGYCQIDGMIDETQTAEKLAAPAQPWEFRSKKAYQRLLIMAGGVMVNFFLALIIYSAVFYHWGDEYYALQDMEMGMKFNDDAKALGFKDGDIIVSTDKGELKDFSADLMRDLASCNQAVVKRGGTTMAIKMPGDLSLLDMLKSDPVFCRPLIPCDVDTVIAGSVAEKAGIKKGDKIVSIDNRPLDSWNAFSFETTLIADALTDCQSKKDSVAVLTRTLVWKNSATQALDTAQVVFDVQEDRPVLGVGMTTLADYYKPRHVDYGFFESIKAGCEYGLDVLGGYVGDLKYVFTKEGAKSLGGFGAIGGMFPPVWDWMMFWRMTAFLSIILAFMNIIPIPGLDGGHILFLLYEVVTRKQPSLRFMQIAQNIGMGFLLLLMVVANLNDILRWLGVM